jgi:hypothetical protein
MRAARPEGRNSSFTILRIIEGGWGFQWKLDMKNRRKDCRDVDRKWEGGSNVFLVNSGI